MSPAKTKRTPLLWTHPCSGGHLYPRTCQFEQHDFYSGDAFIGTNGLDVGWGIVCLLVRYLDIRIFEQFALTAYGFNLALLIATVFVGKSVYGSKRWLELGGFVLQPSELMKVSLILALARVIHRSKGEEEYTIRHLIKPFALILLPCGLVVNQPDWEPL